MKTFKQVKDIIDETIRKNASELKMALISPISEEYPFSTNGIYFLIGMPGSGKSFFIWKHILITERILNKPLYSKIIFCSTSGKMDKTAEAMSTNIKTPIIYLSETELIPYLTKHVKRKLKYYSIVKHVLSKMKNTDEKMKQLIEKYHLEKIEDRLIYIANKLAEYGTVDYPFNTLLILDDFAGSPLLKKTDSELNRLLTKNRHYNLTCIIAIQTHIFINKNIKRMATDVVVYSGYSREDMETMLKQIPNNLNKKEIVDKYLLLKNPHQFLQMNIIARNYVFSNND